MKSYWSILSTPANPSLHRPYLCKIGEHLKSREEILGAISEDFECLQDYNVGDDYIYDSWPLVTFLKRDGEYDYPIALKWNQTSVFINLIPSAPDQCKESDISISVSAKTWKEIHATGKEVYAIWIVKQDEYNLAVEWTVLNNKISFGTAISESQIYLKSKYSVPLDNLLFLGALTYLEPPMFLDVENFIRAARRYHAARLSKATL